MSEQAQSAALAAASAATEAAGALITYGREGGAIDSPHHHDMLYPLVDASRLALEAFREARGELDSDDGQLLAALIHWIEA